MGEKEPETAQEPPRPEDYSRCMGTLNRHLPPEQ